MKSISITSANLDENLICPTSKSYAARALIIASLMQRNYTLKNLPLAQDTKDLISCLELIGLKIKRVNDYESIITNSFPACEHEFSELEINLGEGGTTARFLIPMLCLGQRPYRLIFSGRMVDRPMDELYKPLQELGAVVKKIENGIIIKGPLNPSPSQSIVVDCSKSSQFASGLRLVNFFYPFQLELKNMFMSRKYYELTNHILEKMSETSAFEIPADFSSAGYIIAFAIFTNDVIIQNIKTLDHFQADASIVKILKEIGLDISLAQDGLHIPKAKNELKGMRVSGDDCIDLIPTLFFIASHIDAESIFTNLGGLIYKESNRFQEMLRVLSFFRVDYTYLDGVLTIRGSSTNFSFEGENIGDFIPAADHRMVMVTALFSKLRGGGVVQNAHAVSKSFPQFFDFFS